MSSIVLSLLLSLTGCTQGWMQKKVGPAPAYIASVDPHFVSRGKYLADNVLGCMSCHSDVNKEVFAQPSVDGTMGQGGFAWSAEVGFPGHIVAPNITPFGIGAWTDGEVLHAMTAGLHREGHALFPVMPYPIYGTLTETDAKAVVSYLRTVPSIETEPYPRTLSLILKKVANKVAAPPSYSDPLPVGNVLARGEYLTRVAGCEHCHTPQKGGKPDSSQRFAGGQAFQMVMGTAVSPNISPAEGRGVGYWSETDFLNKFKHFRSDASRQHEAGPGDPNTPMPWFDYAGMTDEDLSAIWVYLQTVEPQDNEVESRWIPR